MRIGQGYDVHALVQGRKLIVGGVTIPFQRGSRALRRRRVDPRSVRRAARRGRARGHRLHFPDTDPKHRNANSRAFLREVAKKVRLAGFSIVNLDATIIAQAPKMARIPRRWSRIWPPTSKSTPVRLTSRPRPPSGSAQSAAAKASPPRRSPCSSKTGDRPRFFIASAPKPWSVPGFFSPFQVVFLSSSIMCNAGHLRYLLRYGLPRSPVLFFG